MERKNKSRCDTGNISAALITRAICRFEKPIGRVDGSSMNTQWIKIAAKVTVANMIAAAAMSRLSSDKGFSLIRASQMVGTGRIGA